MRICGTLATLQDERPEQGVVQVVDVRCGIGDISTLDQIAFSSARTVSLPPGEVVADYFRIWVLHYSTVEGWAVLKCRVLHILRPIEDV